MAKTARGTTALAGGKPPATAFRKDEEVIGQFRRHDKLGKLFAFDEEEEPPPIQERVKAYLKAQLTSERTKHWLQVLLWAITSPPSQLVCLRYVVEKGPRNGNAFAYLIWAALFLLPAILGFYFWRSTTPRQRARLLGRGRDGDAGDVRRDGYGRPSSSERAGGAAGPRFIMVQSQKAGGGFTERDAPRSSARPKSGGAVLGETGRLAESPESLEGYEEEEEPRPALLSRRALLLCGSLHGLELALAALAFHRKEAGAGSAAASFIVLSAALDVAFSDALAALLFRRRRASQKALSCSLSLSSLLISEGRLPVIVDLVASLGLAAAAAVYHALVYQDQRWSLRSPAAADVLPLAACALSRLARCLRAALHRRLLLARADEFKRLAEEAGTAEEPHFFEGTPDWRGRRLSDKAQGRLDAAFANPVLEAENFSIERVRNLELAALGFGPLIAAGLCVVPLAVWSPGGFASLSPAGIGPGAALAFLAYVACAAANPFLAHVVTLESSVGVWTGVVVISIVGNVGFSSLFVDRPYSDLGSTRAASLGLIAGALAWRTHAYHGEIERNQRKMDVSAVYRRLPELAEIDAAALCAVGRDEAAAVVEALASRAAHEPVFPFRPRFAGRRLCRLDPTAPLSAAELAGGSPGTAADPFAGSAPPSSGLARPRVSRRRSTVWPQLATQNSRGSIAARMGLAPYTPASPPPRASSTGGAGEPRRAASLPPSRRQAPNTS
eukprot:tig00021036_g17330.t1